MADNNNNHYGAEITSTALLHGVINHHHAPPIEEGDIKTLRDISNASREVREREKIRTTMVAAAELQTLPTQLSTCTSDHISESSLREFNVMAAQSTSTTGLVALSNTVTGLVALNNRLVALNNRLDAKYIQGARNHNLMARSYNSRCAANRHFAGTYESMYRVQAVDLTLPLFLVGNNNLTNAFNTSDHFALGAGLPISLTNAQCNSLTTEEVVGYMKAYCDTFGIDGLTPHPRYPSKFRAWMGLPTTI